MDPCGQRSISTASGGSSRSHSSDIDERIDASFNSGMSFVGMSSFEKHAFIDEVKDVMGTLSSNTTYSKAKRQLEKRFGRVLSPHEKNILTVYLMEEEKKLKSSTSMGGDSEGEDSAFSSAVSQAVKQAAIDQPGRMPSYISLRQKFEKEFDRELSPMEKSILTSHLMNLPSPQQYLGYNNGNSPAAAATPDASRDSARYDVDTGMDVDMDNVSQRESSMVDRMSVEMDHSLTLHGEHMGSSPSGMSQSPLHATQKSGGYQNARGLARNHSSPASGYQGGDTIVLPPPPTPPTFMGGGHVDAAPPMSSFRNQPLYSSAPHYHMGPSSREDSHSRSDPNMMLNRTGSYPGDRFSLGQDQRSSLSSQKSTTLSIRERKSTIGAAKEFFMGFFQEPNHNSTTASQDEGFNEYDTDAFVENSHTVAHQGFCHICGNKLCMQGRCMYCDASASAHFDNHFHSQGSFNPAQYQPRQDADGTHHQEQQLPSQDHQVAQNFFANGNVHHGDTVPHPQNGGGQPLGGGSVQAGRDPNMLQNGPGAHVHPHTHTPNPDAGITINEHHYSPPQQPATFENDFGMSQDHSLSDTRGGFMDVTGHEEPFPGWRDSCVSLNSDLLHVQTQVQQPRGTTIDDFDLIKVLGKGSYGKVMMVRKMDSGKIFALKTLRKVDLFRSNQIDHTRTERKILQHIRHPFLVQLRYAFQTVDKLYLVCDYMTGGELFFWLKVENTFSENRAKLYAAEMILGLEALHSYDCVYRDLKPENVLLDSSGHVRLTDFGLCKEKVRAPGIVQQAPPAGMSETDMTYTFCGTPEYLAPEILVNKGHGKAVDWWSLGTLFYEMIVGLPPFYDENKRKM